MTTQWTAITLRLPEEGTPVLVARTEGGMAVAQMIMWQTHPDSAEKRPAWRAVGSWLAGVTHWRELPEPPPAGGAGP